MIAKPGSIKPHKKFKGEVYVLSKDEGGRHTPFFKGYRPQFYFRTTDVTGVAQLPAGMEMVMPGDNVQLEIELITPIAMDKGLRFAIREGGRTVGAGTVSEIIELEVSNMASENITFQCTECKRKNYTSMKNKKTYHGTAGDEEVLPFCRKHHPHKEIK